MSEEVENTNVVEGDPFKVQDGTIAAEPEDEPEPTEEEEDRIGIYRAKISEIEPGVIVFHGPVECIDVVPRKKSRQTIEDLLEDNPENYTEVCVFTMRVYNVKHCAWKRVVTSKSGIPS